MGNALIRDWQTAQKQIGQVRQIGQMNQPFVGNLSVDQIQGSQIFQTGQGLCARVSNRGISNSESSQQR